MIHGTTHCFYFISMMNCFEVMKLGSFYDLSGAIPSQFEGFLCFGRLCDLSSGLTSSLKLSISVVKFSYIGKVMTVNFFVSLFCCLRMDDYSTDIYLVWLENAVTSSLSFSQSQQYFSIPLRLADYNFLLHLIMHVLTCLLFRGMICLNKMLYQIEVSM